MIVHFYSIRPDWAQQLWHKNTFNCKSFCIYYHQYYVASYLLLCCKHEKCNKLKKRRSSQQFGCWQMVLHAGYRTNRVILNCTSPSTHRQARKYSLRKLKAFAWQILQRYLTKEGCVRKLFYCLIWIKEPCVRKFEGLTGLKILGILQTEW